MLKKLIVSTVFVVSMLMGGLVHAQASATPSTNSDNKSNNWAHFVIDEIRPGEIDVTLNQNTAFNYSFYSCFEYRSDGEPTSDTRNNFNPAITDGLWPYTCVNTEPKSITLDACEYVEIRMVFGAEADERFDWTRVDVEPGSTSPDCQDESETPTNPDTPENPVNTTVTTNVSKPQVDAPVSGVKAGSKSTTNAIVALFASVLFTTYGIIRLRKYGL